MDEINILEDLGLSEAESKVYLALLETGSTLAGLIIKKTALHRGTTYQILQRLIEKGLVSFVIKSGKRYFEATNPNRFLEMLKEKEEKLKEIMPSLMQKRELSKQNQEVNVYSGYKGIKTVCENILQELKDGGEYLDFGVSGLFKEIMGTYWDQWQRKKKKYNIKAKCIFDEALKQKDPNLLNDNFGEARFHSQEFKSMTDTIIYNDTVVLFIWTGKPPIAIVIENEENAESYRNQFSLMWNNSKK
ncbi:MAG: helix-turn-helix domain-containing protein [Nanoarchaeota archaeon]|nr:helix-turn-helix domain-containing protein [Nanoarchaeota archaeon]